VRGLFLAEAIKVKRSSVILFIIAGGILPAVTNAFLRADFEWARYAVTSLLILNMSNLIIVPSLAGYLISGEFEKQTMSALLSSPVPRTRILVAKFLVMAALLACLALLSTAFTLASGFIHAGGVLPADGVAARYAYMAVVSVGMHLAIVPTAFLVALIGRKTIAPIILALGLLLLYGAFAFTDAGDFIPSCLPVLFLIDYSGFNPYGAPRAFDAARSVILLGAWFLLFSFLSAVVFARKEHAGT
jgi:ABC-type transport system involved in multi-copper enzyme maturation permease subunit